MTNTITAIVLNYNQSEDLHFSVRSVIGQSQKFDEVIIYDDASNDDSVAVITELIKGKENTRLVELPKNVGPNAVVAIGIEEAKSDFVFFVSSNNVLNHHIVEEFRRIICVVPDAMMISGNICIETQKKQIIELKLPLDQSSVWVTPDKIEAQLSKGIFTFFGGANIIRKDCLIKNKYLQIETKWHADWLMYLLVALYHPVALSRISFCTHKFKRQRYSDGMYQVREQRQVTESFIRSTKEKFPSAHQIFARHGVLPFHSASMLAFILSRKDLRSFFSIKLAYYCLFFWALKKAAIFIPIEAKNALRKVFRI